MELTQQFLLMVQGPSERGEIIDRVRTAVPYCLPLKANAFTFRDNLIEVWANPLAEMSRVDDPVDGYQFYAFRVEGTPLVDVSERNQVALAKQLIALLTQSGWSVVPCANFEDQL